MFILCSIRRMIYSSIDAIRGKEEKESKNWNSRCIWNNVLMDSVKREIKKKERNSTLMRLQCVLIVLLKAYNQRILIERFNSKGKVFQIACSSMVECGMNRNGIRCKSSHKSVPLIAPTNHFKKYSWIPWSISRQEKKNNKKL